MEFSWAGSLWKGIHKKTKEVRTLMEVSLEDFNEKEIMEILEEEIPHMKEIDNPYIVVSYQYYLSDNRLWVHSFQQHSIFFFLSLCCVLWIETISSSLLKYLLQNLMIYS
jgi:hypothetical protein